MKERIRVVNSMLGYAHTKFYGTCDQDVTEKEIADLIYHVCFGGREVKIKDGQWTAIRHDD